MQLTKQNNESALDEAREELTALRNASVMKGMNAGGSSYAPSVMSGVGAPPPGSVAASEPGMRLELIDME